MQKQSKKRKNNNQSSFKKKIIFRILVIGAGASFLLTMVFGILYQQSMMKDYRSEIQSHMHDMDTVINSYVDNTTALTLTLYNSPEGTLARVDKDYKMAEYSSFLGYVRNLMLNTQYINSIYFISQEGSISMWAKGGGSYTKDINSETLSAELLDRKTSPFIWEIPYRYGEQEIAMLTFFFHETPLEKEYYTGTIVVNVELRELNKRIFGKNSSATEMMMISKEGLVVLHSDAGYIGKDLSEEEFVQKALAGETLFHMRVDGKLKQFICMPSQLPDFYLITQSNTADILGLMSAFLIVPLVYLLIIVVMTILSIRTGNRLVQPLTQTVEEIRQSSMGKRIEMTPETDRDELHFLQEYAAHVNQYVENILENDQKNRVIFNLLRNSRGMDIQPFLLERGFLRANAGYCVITAEFICQYEVTELEELNSIRQSIVEGFSDILKKYGHSTCFENGLRHLLFLLAEEDTPLVAETLQAELDKKCVQLMRENLETDIYATLSECIEDSNVPCKPIVKKNMERMEVLPIYQLKGTRLVQAATRVKPSEKAVEGCLQALKNKDRDRFMEAVEAMLQETEEVNYPQFLAWVVYVRERIGEVKAAMYRNYVKTDRSTLYEQAQQIHDREGVVQWFELIYDDVCERMEQIRKTTTTDLLEDAIEYITQNFGDSQLGATSLANRLHLSAQYFGQLFMEFTGKSVSEYIVQVRMEKARNYLLARPEMEIMEIAEKVGYHSASYFSTAFKKYYGVTPSKLRSNLNIQERTEVN